MRLQAFGSNPATINNPNQQQALQPGNPQFKRLLDEYTALSNLAPSPDSAARSRIADEKFAISQQLGGENGIQAGYQYYYPVAQTNQSKPAGPDAPPTRHVDGPVLPGSPTRDRTTSAANAVGARLSITA